MWGHWTDWLPHEHDGSGVVGPGPTHHTWALGEYLWPSINGHLHYPNDVDRPLNEDVTDKIQRVIRKYHVDYNNRPSNDISFISSIVSTSGRIHSEFVSLLFLQVHRETDLFFNLQKFSLRNILVDSSTSTTRCSPHNSRSKWVTS